VIFLSIQWFMSIIPKGAPPHVPGSSISDQGPGLAGSSLKKRFSAPISAKASTFKVIVDQKRKSGVGGRAQGEVDPAEDCLSQALAMHQPWQRPEGLVGAPPAAPPKTATLTIPEAAQRAGCERILLGPGETGTIARIQFGSGSVAGTEIQLRASEKGLEASVLQTSAAARSSVSSAIQEMAARMRRRGHTVHLAQNAQARQNEENHGQASPDD
jgi:hypothetical protein